MTSQWKTIVFWVGAILMIVVATLFYQPAAAKTGSLLVWTRNRVYVMDIDTLTLARVGPAKPGQLISPSPGCSGQVDEQCWVMIGETAYQVDLSIAGSHGVYGVLPVGDGFRWDNTPVSWSPDGKSVAYSVLDRQTGQAELRVYNLATTEVKLKAANVEPTVAVAWAAGCASGLGAADCGLAYIRRPAPGNEDAVPLLVGHMPATGDTREWALSNEPVFELRWTDDGELLFSQPKRHFKRAEDHAWAFQIPAGSKLANLSPSARYAVYYQPFTLEDCQTQDLEDRCLHLGVWLNPTEGDGDQRSLIYSVDLADSTDTEGLNFIPIWSPDEASFVFFQAGQLINYDLEKQEATIWYKPVAGKLRTVPVFSPNEEAVAFVDNQGQGFSEYRLVVVNPRLQPVEHIIETRDGFRILAWLPN
ncbi:MAG: hypothetical protein OES12_13440 [Anaerolineae bacterium]|nr:hypothetical protein [Anaerolineae bacterium]